MQPNHPREMRLCAWCGAPCSGRDESGDPACPTHASELAAERAPRRVIRLVVTSGPRWLAPSEHDRDVRGFVIGEFRSHGAIV